MREKKHYLFQYSSVRRKKTTNTCKHIDKTRHTITYLPQSEVEHVCHGVVRSSLASALIIDFRCDGAIYTQALQALGVVQRHASVQHIPSVDLLKWRVKNGQKYKQKQNKCKLQNEMMEW